MWSTHGSLDKAVDGHFLIARRRLAGVQILSKSFMDHVDRGLRLIPGLAFGEIFLVVTSSRASDLSVLAFQRRGHTLF